MDNIVDLIANVNSSVVQIGGVEVLANSGLRGLWNTVLSDWITPLFIAMVAVFALFFIKDRAWMKLIGFVGIAAVVGVLVFAGGDLFGGKDKGLTKVAKNAANDIQTVNSAETAVGFADQVNHFAE